MARNESRFCWGIQLQDMMQRLIDAGVDPADFSVNGYMTDALMIQGLYDDALAIVVGDRATYITDLKTAEALPDDQWCDDPAPPHQQELIWSERYQNWVWNTICPTCGFRNITPLFLTLPLS